MSFKPYTTTMTLHCSMFYKPNYTYMTVHVDSFLTLEKLEKTLKKNEWEDVEAYLIDKRKGFILIKRKTCKQYYEDINVRISREKVEESNKKKDETHYKYIEQVLKAWHPKLQDN